MVKQVSLKVDVILKESTCYCITTDEWSCIHSYKEYDYASLRHVKPNLEYGTVFISFYMLPSTKSIDATRAII